MRKLVFASVLFVELLAFGDLSQYKWAVIGDSLSDPAHPSAVDAVVKYYHFLARDTGIRVVYTNGVGSTGYKAGSGSGKAFCQRLEANPLPSDVDVVTIFGSVNDGGSATTDEDAGSPEDRLPGSETLAAYINKAIDVVCSQAPGAKLVLVGGLYYCNAHPDRHIRANNTIRAVAAARGVEFHDWLTGNPDDPLDFHQIEVDTKTSGSFAQQYTIDWEKYPDASFGHPNDTYNELWLAPHFGEILTAALLPTLGGVAATPTATNATVSGTVATVGVGASACDVYLAVGANAESLGAATRIAAGLGQSDSFSYVVPGLDAGTTYCYALSVSNNAASPAGTSSAGSFRTKEHPQPVGDLGSFAKKVTFTVEYEGAAPLSDLPVLVKLAANSPVGFSYSDCEADGSDIRFADVGGQAIPFEIDTWNPSGESLVWVKVPSVVQGVAFTMYFSGTPSAANTPSSVWTEYTGVWHLNGLGADATPYSQGLYLNSTATTGIDGHLSVNSIANESGLFGKAFRVNDSTGWKQGNYNEGGVWVEDAGADSPLDPAGVFTISGWFKHADMNYNYGHLFYKRLKADNTDTPDGSFATQLGSGSWDNHVDARGSSSTRVRATTDFSLKNVWVYLSFVYNGGTCSVYANGVLVNSGSITTATDNDAPLVFGNNVNVASGETGDSAWSGLIDEVRYLRTAKSSAWIAAEYAAMASDAFVAAGEVIDVDTPTLGEVTVAPRVTDATISGTITSLGAGATACDVYLAYGTDAQHLPAATKVVEGATDSFAYMVPNLRSKKTYYYVVSISNDVAGAKDASASGSFTTLPDPTGGFAKRVAFTVNGTAGAGQSNIPVLVKLSESGIRGFDYGACNPSKIVFVDADGMILPYEVDTWNTSGESLVWVKVASPAKDSVFYMYFDGESAEANDPSAVWSGYTGVWHLNEAFAEGDSSLTQSQGVYSNSTAEAGIDGHLSVNSFANETGRFGKAFKVNASTQYKDTSSNNIYKHGGVWVADSGANSPLDADGVFTISGWFKHQNWNYYYDYLFSKRKTANNGGSPNNAFAIQLANNAAASVSPRGSGATTTARALPADKKGDWAYITFVYDNATCTVYENGVLVDTVTVNKALDNNGPLVFGNNTDIATQQVGDAGWIGWIDEVRFLKGAKSAAWIAAEYEAMASDTFVSAGAVERVGKGLLLILR